MPYSLLPKFLENPTVNPTESGKWLKSSDTEGFLRNLAESLEVTKASADTFSIDSIPDVWARPLFFQTALYAGALVKARTFDAGLHKKILGEWRAILAMLALQDSRHLKLTVDAVHLNAATNDLEKIFLQLVPKDYIKVKNQTNSPWSDVYVISFNGAPIAITSPTTLVAAAADYSNALSGKLTQPWSNDDKTLCDPLAYLTSNELSGLHLWLTDLKNSITNPANVQTGGALWNQLTTVLNDYINDVSKKLNGAVVAAGMLVPTKLNMHIGLAQFMNKTIQAAAPATATSSMVRLLPSNARTNTPPLLLVSPEMLNDLSVSRGLSKAQLIVWSGLTAANISEQSLTDNHSMLDGVPLGNAQWRRPEEFFTERLTIHSGGDVFKNVLNIQGADILSKEGDSMILPLHREILDYFTPQEIAKRLRIDKDSDAYKVQFDFPISGVNGKSIDYRVEKSYPMQEINYLERLVPVVELWPNFKRPGWSKYYLYYENSDAQNEASGVGQEYFYVYPWAYGKNIAGDTPANGLKNLYTAKLDGFPEALLCTSTPKSDNNLYTQNVEAGILLLPEPPSVPAKLGQNWQVGIDFGTSSTMIFLRNGTNEPQPLKLKPNLLQVTDSKRLRLRTFSNFIPSMYPEERDGSFLSIFQLLNISQDGGPIQTIRPLQDGNVFLLPSAVGQEAIDFREKNSQIDANLKWQKEPLAKLKVGAYIQQICLQTLVEAAQNGVGKISWNFSYPTAFAPADQVTFISTCETAAEFALKNSGFDETTKLDDWSESKAAAYYFNTLGKVNFAGGAICLDIGAGTTDVSIISGAPPKIVYHTSLQFAGRYLFRSLYRNYNLFTNSPMNLDDLNEESRNALIDADMRQHSQLYLSDLKNKSGLDEVQQVLQMSQFAAAGIFYYLGGLIGLLHSREIYEGDEVPDVYVGGNGSRIFHWICGDKKFNPRSPYISVFRDMLTETSGLTAYGFKLVLSTSPKVEVARGMLESKPAHHAKFFDAKEIAKNLFGDDGRDPLIANSVFAGDNFRQGKTEHKATDFLSARDINSGVSIKKAEGLRAFKNAFNQNGQEIWGNHLTIGEYELSQVAKGVTGAYSQDIGRKENEISVQPVFILELKNYMEMFA